MNKFFVDENAVGDGSITITGDDYNHIANVLRMKTGEQIYVSTGSDREYLCEISAFDEGYVRASIVDVYGSNREIPAKITLYQALPKGDKMATIIQKAVELGAYKVVPVITDRVIVKLDDKKRDKKVARWNAISQSAAKQSKRNVIPEVSNPVRFKEAIKEASDMGYAIIPYENAEGMDGSREIFDTIAKNSEDKDIAVFIGPEGGFSDAEIELASNAGVKPITLGHRILRTETAGVTVLSILMFMLDRD